MALNLSEKLPKRTRVMSITSGKGGVGKTTISANLAVSLGREGKRVLILDGDFGMANVDIMFNVRPKKNLYDVIQGTAKMSDILIEVARNVTLIPGGSGLFEMRNLSNFEKQALLDRVSELESTYDMMLIDTAPGIDENVLYLNSAAQEIHVVVTPDPSSLADSYALIKVLNQRYRENRFTILCNQVKDENDGQKLYEKLDAIARKFLFVSLDYGGSIPLDPNLRQATRTQQLVTRAYPDSTASISLRKISQNLKGYEPVDGCKGNLQFFWQQLVGVA